MTADILKKLSGNPVLILWGDSDKVRRFKIDIDVAKITPSGHIMVKRR